MFTPVVTEIPRRTEPVAHDTFIAAEADRRTATIHSMPKRDRGKPVLAQLRPALGIA